MRDFLEFIIGIIIIIVLWKNIDLVVEVVTKIISLLCNIILAVVDKINT